MRVVIILSAAALLLVSFPAAASGFGPGFLIAVIGLFIVSVWPLLLPLLYLRGASKKLRLYFALALVTFGVVGLLSVPFQFLGLIGLPALFDGTIQPESFSGAGVLYFVHPLAFGFSLWALPKAKRLLADKLDAAPLRNTV